MEPQLTQFTQPPSPKSNNIFPVVIVSVLIFIVTILCAYLYYNDWKISGKFDLNKNDRTLKPQEYPLDAQLQNIMVYDEVDFGNISISKKISQSDLPPIISNLLLSTQNLSVNSTVFKSGSNGYSIDYQVAKSGNDAFRTTLGIVHKPSIKMISAANTDNTGFINFENSEYTVKITFIENTKGVTNVNIISIKK